MIAVTSLALAIALASCGGDSGREDRSGSAPTTGPFVAGPGIVPADAADIGAAADVKAMLTSVGFPAAWLVPDGLTAAEVAGVLVRQSSGDERTTYTYQFAFARRSGSFDAITAEWYGKYAEALGAEAALTKGTKRGNDVSGLLYSGGLPEDPGGRLTVTTVGVEGSSDPVVVEVELKIEGPAAVPTLQLSPALISELPAIDGCTPFLVVVDYATYASPSSTNAEPAYRTIYDGNCADDAALAATRVWVEGRDGFSTQNDEYVEITDTPGSSGKLIHVRAAANSAMRIDTEQSLR